MITLLIMVLGAGVASGVGAYWVTKKSNAPRSNDAMADINQLLRDNVDQLLNENDKLRKENKDLLVINKQLQEQESLNWRNQWNTYDPNLNGNGKHD